MYQTIVTKFVITKMPFCKICDSYFDISNYCDKICHYKNAISVRYVTNTLMYQTIVTKFVTSGTKM